MNVGALGYRRERLYRESQERADRAALIVRRGELQRRVDRWIREIDRINEALGYGRLRRVKKRGPRRILIKAEEITRLISMSIPERVEHISRIAAENSMSKQAVYRWMSRNSRDWVLREFHQGSKNYASC
jgi:hypothetical protein